MNNSLNALALIALLPIRDNIFPEILHAPVIVNVPIPSAYVGFNEPLNITLFPVDICNSVSALYVCHSGYFLILHLRSLENDIVKFSNAVIFKPMELFIKVT